MIILPIDPSLPVYIVWENANLNFSGTPVYLSTSANGSYMFVGTSSTSTSIGDRVYSITEDLTNTPMFGASTSDLTGMAVGAGDVISLL